MTEESRLYGDLAGWWPLISPPDDYADEAAVVTAALDSADLDVRDVLELGSGGGHNALHLKRRFTMTLADLSPRMLAVSRELNPECEHVEGDMRDLRLGRAFDAVFVHDAVGYLLTEDDLAATIATAFAHCRPGGAAVLWPDHTTETFAARTDHGGGDADDGRGARFLGWTWDSDPDDTWVRTEYVLLLREKDGSTETVHETHRIGLFGRDVWLRLLAAAGFESLVLTRRDGPDDAPRDLFIGHRPG